MPEFKIGDVVWLKSGGLNMTVRETDEKGVLCDWSESRTQNLRGFPREMLDLVRSASPPAPEPIGMTPGKWISRLETCGKPDIVNVDKTGKQLGDIICEPYDEHDPHWPTNARAICQVPAMVRLIEKIVGNRGYCTLDQRDAEAILKAIKGDP